MPPTAKDRFTSLDTLALVRELRGFGRAWVDKAFDVTTGGWSLALRSPGEGRRELLLVPGRYAALLPSGLVEHAGELSPLAKELRRVLVGAGLESASEPGGERYLEIRFGRRDNPEAIVLALEMFGEGNLLLAEGGRLVAVARARRWAHRVVRAGGEYARPPVRTDPWSVDRATLGAELARSRSDLASTLAARLSFGGPVAEELVVRAGLDGSGPSAAQPADAVDRLSAAVAELLAEVGEAPRGFLYVKDGTAIDATPYPSRRWASEHATEEARPTFSEAAFEYFRALVPAPANAAEAAATRQRQSLERLREQQRAAVGTLSESIDRERAAAEAIYANYPAAEAALEAARAEAAHVADITVTLGDVEVSLQIDRSPRESAQAIYDEVKRLQSKLAGARTALAETEAKVARPSTEPEPGAPAGLVAPTRRRAPHWFERFRWFVSSEGVVVIAGRDAASNDLVVRRNLKDGDVYVHADLHGAASVVVKHPPPGRPPIGEATLREAGQWAVVYSKAWRAGLASASAFWVTPEQVSKSGASGEFVAKGAWAIHGTKHVLRDLPTEIALGTIDYDGETLWTAAPPAAFRTRGTVRAVLLPGPERERDALERALVGELGLNRTRLQSLLPAGGLARRA